MPVPEDIIILYAAKDVQTVRSRSVGLLNCCSVERCYWADGEIQIFSRLEKYLGLNCLCNVGEDFVAGWEGQYVHFAKSKDMKGSGLANVSASDLNQGLTRLDTEITHPRNDIRPQLQFGAFFGVAYKVFGRLIKKESCERENNCEQSNTNTADCVDLVSELVKKREYSSAA